MTAYADHERALKEADAAFRALLISPKQLTDDGKAYIVSDEWWDKLERLDAAYKAARNALLACDAGLIVHGAEPVH